MHHGRVVPMKEAADLLEAETDLGILAESPPELVAGAGDGLGARAPTELIASHGAMPADLIEEFEQVPGTQRVEAWRGGHAGPFFLGRDAFFLSVRSLASLRR